MLTEAISRYDNSVIVGITLFYSVLSVLSLILGDILMAMADPRISLLGEGEVSIVEQKINLCGA